MKKSMIIITALLAMALVTASAFAWGPGHGRGYGNNQDCPRYDGQGAGQSFTANLTQEQKDELTALRQKYIDETYEIRSLKFQKHQEMKLLMETSAPDREKLSVLSEEIADISKQLREKRIDFALEAKKISPEIGMGQGRGRWSKRGGRGFCGQGGGQNGFQQQAPQE